MEGLLNETTKKLHHNILQAASKNEIESGETSIRIPQFTRLLLRLMAIAQISDPVCSLGALPVERMKYKEDGAYMREIIGPAIKTHGFIKEGE